MTETDISYMTNTELSENLKKASNYLTEAVNAMNIDESAKDAAFTYISLMKEASRRLNIPFHITFEDESFCV